MTPEGKVKDKINRQLKKLVADGYGVWKFMPVQMGMGIPALDYLLCINGYFIAIEAKAPGKKPTPRQRKTAEEITAAGGMVFVIDGEDIGKQVFERIRKICIAPPVC